MILRVETYDELERHARGFVAVPIPLLIVVGPGGTGKTTTIRGAVGDSGRFVGGVATPLGLFHELRRSIDLPIIVDDVDRLWRDRDSVSVLKQATQSERIRTVQWLSKAVPEDEREFRTSSPIALLFNQLDLGNADLKALADRALFVRFSPTPFEIHLKAGQWFQDREIYDYIGSLVEDADSLTFRSYRHAAELKAYGEDWRAALQQDIRSEPTVRALRAVHRDPELRTSGERVAAWCGITGLDRATYYRIAKAHPDIATMRHYSGARRWAEEGMSVARQ